MSAADAKRLKNLLSANILGLRIPKENKSNRNVILKQLVKNQQVVDSMNQAIQLIQEACPSTARWNKGDSGMDDLWYVITNYGKQPDNYKGAITSFLNVLFESPTFKENKLEAVESHIRGRLGIHKVAPPRTDMPTQGGQAYFTQPTPSEAKVHHDTQKGGSAYVPSNLNPEDGKGHMVPETNPDAFMLPEIAPETTSIQNASTDLSTAEPKKQNASKTTAPAPTSSGDTKHMKSKGMSATPGYRMPKGDTQKTDGSTPGTTQLEPENKKYQRAYGEGKAQVEVYDSIMNEVNQGESTPAGHQQLAPHTYETTGLGTGGLGTMGATPDVGTTPGPSLTTAPPKPTETPSGANSGSTIYGGRLKPQPITQHQGGMRKEQLPPGATIRDEAPAGSFEAFSSFMHWGDADFSQAKFNWNEVMEMGEWALGIVGALNGASIVSASPASLKKALAAALVPLGGARVLSSNKLIASLAGGEKPETLKKLVSFYRTLYNSYTGTPESASDSPGWAASASDWITQNRGAQGAFGRVINEYDSLRGEALRDAPANVNSGLQALNDILSDGSPAPVPATTPLATRSIGPPSTKRPLDTDADGIPGAFASSKRGRHGKVPEGELAPTGTRRRLLGVGDTGDAGDENESQDRLTSEGDDNPFPMDPDHGRKPLMIGARGGRPAAFDLKAAVARRKAPNTRDRFLIRGPIDKWGVGTGRDSYFRQIIYDLKTGGVTSRFRLDEKNGDVIDQYAHERLKNGYDLRNSMYADITYENDPTTIKPVVDEKHRQQGWGYAYVDETEASDDAILAQRRMADFYADDTYPVSRQAAVTIADLVIEAGLNRIRGGDPASVQAYMNAQYDTWDDLYKRKAGDERTSERLEPYYGGRIAKWAGAGGLGGGGGVPPVIPGGGGRGLVPPGAPPVVPPPAGRGAPVVGGGGSVPGGPPPMAGPIANAPVFDQDHGTWLRPVSALSGAPGRDDKLPMAPGRAGADGKFYDETGAELKRADYEEKYSSQRDLSGTRSAYVRNTGGPQSVGKENDSNGIDNYYVPQLRLSFREGDADIVTRINENPQAISADRKMWQEFRGYHYEANQEPDNPLHSGVILDEARRFYEPLDKDDILLGQAEAAIQESYDCQMTAFTYPEEFKVYGDPFVLDTRGGGPLEPLDEESTYAQFHDVYWGQEGILPKSSPWNQFTQADGSQLPDSAIHGNTVFSGNDLPLLSVENAFIFTTSS